MSLRDLRPEGERMDVRAVFGIQFLLSVLVFSLLAKWFLVPWLREKSRSDALFWLSLPHVSRHVGLVFLVPGIVSESLPTSFARAAAFGDLTAGVLALLVVVALRGRWAAAVPLAWLFNVVGTVDLINALRQADAIPHLGAAWYIPTFLVPLLLVTHAMSFKWLLKTKP
jgi:hypothetical protein